MLHQVKDNIVSNVGDCTENQELRSFTNWKHDSRILLTDAFITLDPNFKQFSYL